MSTALDRELETYELHKNELVDRAAGKFVLIKAGEIIGIFDTQADAIRYGYERFGNVPFLVKEIVALELPLVFTSNLLRV